MDDASLWTKVAAVGQIAAAVGTFAAVCVSLWIALSERQARIKVSAGLRLIFAGDGSPFEDGISIRITNCGLRPVRISSIGWRTGWMRYGPKWLKFQHAMQRLDQPIVRTSGPTPPFDLGPGQEVTLLLPPDPFRKNPGELRKDFFSRHLPWRSEGSSTKVCVVVWIVAAKASVTRVERGLEKFLATGVITDGADKANRAAEAKIASA